MTFSDQRWRVAVHKMGSCDGCQLAFLNMGAGLVLLSRRVDFVHFPEMGPVNPDARVDIAFVEGSIGTADDQEEIHRIRANSRYLITIGACATAGGIQALRNGTRAGAWPSAIYPSPEYLNVLDRSTAVAEEVSVDLELWGCPVNSRQIEEALQSLLSGAAPREETDRVCLECKRRQQICVMVTKGTPCLGPVTRTGCGAICPAFDRGCYGCYGPSENPQTHLMGTRFAGLGLLPPEIARRFLFITSGAPAFGQEGNQWKKEDPHGQ